MGRLILRTLIEEATVHQMSWPGYLFPHEQSGSRLGSWVHG